MDDKELARLTVDRLLSNEETVNEFKELMKKPLVKRKEIGGDDE